MEIRLSNEAVRQYRRLNEPTLSRITEAIDKLELEPPEGDIIKLTDKENEYRLRIGGHRIIFKKEGDYILVSRIIQRGQAYKDKE